MIVEVVSLKAPADLTHALFDVSVTGTVMTVSAGTFKIDGVDYTLTEDETFDFAPLPAKTTYYAAYLVRVKEGGELRVLVDEVQQGRDDDYDFGESSPYTRLSKIWHARIEGGRPDLLTERLIVRQIQGV
jgi:hypothetical protein